MSLGRNMTSQIQNSTTRNYVYVTLNSGNVYIKRGNTKHIFITDNCGIHVLCCLISKDLCETEYSCIFRWCMSSEANLNVGTKCRSKYKIEKTPYMSGLDGIKMQFASGGI